MFCCQIAHARGSVMMETARNARTKLVRELETNTTRPRRADRKAADRGPKALRADDGSVLIRYFRNKIYRQLFLETNNGPELL